MTLDSTINITDVLFQLCQAEWHQASYRRDHEEDFLVPTEGWSQLRNRHTHKTRLILTEKPAKARQKDVVVCWTLKVSKAKPTNDGARNVDIALSFSSAAY